MRTCSGLFLVLLSSSALMAPAAVMAQGSARPPHWTTAGFPKAKEIAKRISRKIEQLKLDAPESEVAKLIVESAD